ncbi:predicted protein, partial [Ostreococcus lucimarinus CCE9901]
LAPDLSFMITAATDGVMRLWKVASQPPTVTLEFRGHIGEITCTACASTGLFASSGVDSSIMLWEPRNAKHVGLIKAHDGPITALSFNRDGKLLVSASVDRTCKIHSSLTGKLIVSMNHIHRITCASISLDASCVVTGAGDGTMRLWS